MKPTAGSARIPQTAPDSDRRFERLLRDSVPLDWLQPVVVTKSQADRLMEARTVKGGVPLAPPTSMLTSGPPSRFAPRNGSTAMCNPDAID